MPGWRSSGNRREGGLEGEGGRRGWGGEERGEGRRRGGRQGITNTHASYQMGAEYPSITFCHTCTLPV